MARENVTIPVVNDSVTLEQIKDDPANNDTELSEAVKAGLETIPDTNFVTDAEKFATSNLPLDTNAELDLKADQTDLDAKADQTDLDTTNANVAQNAADIADKLTTVAVDGTTITGDGTVGDPLVAVGGGGGIPDTPNSTPDARVNGAWTAATDNKPYISITSFPATPTEGVATQYTCEFHDKETGELEPENITWYDFDDNVVGSGTSPLISLSVQGVQNIRATYAKNDLHGRPISEDSIVSVDVQEAPGYDAEIFTPSFVEVDSSFDVTVRDDDIEQTTTEILITLVNVTKVLQQNYNLPRINTTSFMDSIDLSASSINAEAGDTIQVQYLEPRDVNNDPRLVTSDLLVTPEGGVNGTIIQEQIQNPTTGTFVVEVADDLSVTTLNVEVIRSDVVVEVDTITLTQVGAQDKYAGSITTENNTNNSDNDGTIHIVDGDVVNCYYTDNRDFQGLSRVIVQKSYVSSQSNMEGLKFDVWSVNMSTGENIGTIEPDTTGMNPDFSRVKWIKGPNSIPFDGPLMWAFTPIPEGRTCYQIDWEDIGAASLNLYAGIGFSSGSASSYRGGSALDTNVGNYCASIPTATYNPQAFITVQRFGDNYDVEIFAKTKSGGVETSRAIHSFTTNKKVYVKCRQLYVNESTSGDHFTRITSSVSDIEYTIPVGYESSFYVNPYAVTPSQTDTGDLFKHSYTNASEIDFKIVPSGTTRGGATQTGLIASGSIPVPFGVAFDSDLTNIVITDDQDNELTSHIQPRFRWVDISGERDWHNSLRNIEYWVQVDLNGAAEIDLKVKFNQSRTLELGAQSPIGTDWTSINDPSTENPTQWPASFSLTEPLFLTVFDVAYTQACYLNFQNAGTTMTLRPDYQAQIDEQYYRDAEALEWVDYPERMWTWFSSVASSRGTWLYQVSIHFLKIYTETGDVRWLRAMQRMSFAYLNYLNSNGYHSGAQPDDLKYSYPEVFSVMGILYGLEDASLRPAYDNTITYISDHYNSTFVDGDLGNKTATERNTCYHLKTYLEKMSYEGYTESEAAKVYGYINKWVEQQNANDVDSWLQNGGVLHSGLSSKDDFVLSSLPVACPWQILLEMNTLQKAFILTQDNKCLKMMSRLADFLGRFAIQENLAAQFNPGSTPLRTISLNYYYVENNIGINDDTFTDPYFGDAIHTLNIISALYKGIYAKQLLGEEVASLMNRTLISQLWDTAILYRKNDYMDGRYVTRLADTSETRPAWAINGNNRSVSLYTVEGQDILFHDERISKFIDIDNEATLVNERSIKVDFESATTIDVVNDVISSADYLQENAVVTEQAAPTKGVVGIIGYDVTYTANSSETGFDNFTLRVTGQTGITADIPVSVEIYPSADAPFISSVNLDVAVDKPITIDLSQYVAGGVGGIDIATATIESNVSEGALDTTNLNTTLEVIYTPTIAYTGADLFTWSIQDNDSPKNQSNTGRVDLDVTSANFPLVEVANNPIQSEVGNRVLVTSADYFYESLNNTAAEIVATVDVVSPDVGLYRNNVLLGATDTFTMQDVLDNLVETEGVNVSPSATTQITVRDTGVPQNSLPGNITGDVIQSGVLWLDEFTSNFAGSASGNLVTDDLVTYPLAQWGVRQDGGSPVVPNIVIAPGAGSVGQCFGDADQFGAERIAVRTSSTNKEYEVDMTTIDLSSTATTSDYLSCGVFITNTDTGWPANSETTFRRVTLLLASFSGWLRIYDNTLNQSPNQICDVVANTFDALKYTLTRDPRFSTDPAGLKADLLTAQLWFRKKDQGIEMYYDAGSGKTLLFSLDNVASGGAEFALLDSRFWFDWYPNTYTIDRMQANEVV